MKINIIGDDPTRGTFPVSLEYIIDEDDEELAQGIAEWVSNTFTRHFVISQHCKKIFAGGASDNRLSWAEGWDADNEAFSTGKYELRCYTEDLTMFLLKYKTE